MKALKVSLVFVSLFLFYSCSQPDGTDSSSPKYTEQHRPQYHFSPPSQWMNDPNGMFFYEGEYHLFYQYYPDSNVWGPMHWGHAVSPDMVQWEHLPVALYPDSLGYIFSGSAVVDWNNTSGFGSSENPPLIAIYTYHDMEGEQSGRTDYQYQGIAYSLDNGRNWTKYEGNPVLPNQGVKDFRDPKVMWFEEGQKWIMTLAEWDHVSFYSSTDLKSWEKESDFGLDYGSHGGVWECPDLFPLQVEGTEEVQWVLLVSINPGGPQGGSATQYFVGDFDGKDFTLDAAFAEQVLPAEGTEQAVWLDYGADNYAGVTWSDVPAEDGRRLFIGWMSNWQYAQVVPTTAWRSAMTIPRVLLLKESNGSFLVQSMPVQELENIAGEEATVTNNVDSTYKLTMEVDGAFLLALSNDMGEQVTMELLGDTLFFDRLNAGITDFQDDFGAVHKVGVKGLQVEKVEVFVDVSSVEVFINDGEIVLTELVFPSKPFIQVESEGERSIVLQPVKSIWNGNSIGGEAL